MAAYHHVAGIGPPAVACDIVARLRKRGMATGLVAAQVAMLEQSEADAAAAAGKTANLLLREAVVGAAGHAAVRADAVFGAAAENRVNLTVITYKIQYIII